MMNFSRAGAGWRALLTVAILLLLSTAPSASSEASSEPAQPSYATISRALDGDPAAIETLLGCANREPDCRMIAAAAQHQLGRTEDAIALLRPLLERGDTQAARVVAELAFERHDYRLAWAAGSFWMEANDLEAPKEAVRDRGMRMRWLMGQSASELSAAELAQAREIAEEIRSDSRTEVRAGEDRASTARWEPHPDTVRRTAPEYPLEMAKAGTGGWATFVVSVSADGKVENVSELFASHPEMAKTGIEAIGQWRFESTEGDDWWTHQTIDFRLEGRSDPIPAADSGVPDEQGWIAFDSARGWIEFTVRVNDVPARAILDSGADSNAISRRLVERAGVELRPFDEVRVQGIYGLETVPTSGKFEMRFGNTIVPMRRAIVLPNAAPDLILGVGLFQASVVQIDYPNKRIRFLDRDAVKFEGNVRTRMKRGRSPQVMAKLGGKKVWMLLDTGNAGTTLFKRGLLQRLDFDQHVADADDVQGFGAVSGGRNRLLQLPDFKLGPFSFDALLASYIEEGGEHGIDGHRAAFGSRIRKDNVPYDGILGSEVLKNFIITADLRNRKVHLELP